MDMLYFASTGNVRFPSAGNTYRETVLCETMNKATTKFAGYAHFEDKYVLLESWMREKFHQALESQLPASSILQMSTLRTLILGVFDFLALVRQYAKLSNRQFEPLFERALQQELSELLLRWLKQAPAKIALSKEMLETTALVISWAILGPAGQWSRGEQTSSAEEMAHHVLAIVVVGLSPVIVIT